MAAELTIKYTADSVEGNSLSTTVIGENNGWVEYCNQRGQLVYADAVTEDFYKKCHQQAIATIVKHALVSDKKQLGFMHHLATVLLNDEFILPMFGVVHSDNQLEITTGLTRIIASMMNGRTATQFKTVAYTPDGQLPDQLKNIKPLTSTSNFEKIYNLKDIDYEIGMSDNVKGDMSEFQFDRSVLKYSIYDKKDQALPHTQIGANVTQFWNKHVRRDKILVNVRCTPEVEKLIQPSEIFNYNIVHEKADEWQWSYGKILGSYRKDESPLNTDESRIHLWLYDVTDPVYLELLLPWVTGQYTCCHTKNKKALFFDTTGDVTSMQVIGDWVK
jgi:hypothetical protein